MCRETRSGPLGAGSRLAFTATGAPYDQGMEMPPQELPGQEPPKYATTFGRVMSWLAILVAVVWVVATVAISIERWDAALTAQQATVTDLTEHRRGGIFTCDVAVEREDGVQEEIRVERSCDEAPAVGEQVKVWVAEDQENYSSYLDGDQEQQGTDDTMATIIMLVFPILALFLPAVFYLRRPKAPR